MNPKYILQYCKQWLKKNKSAFSCLRRFFFTSEVLRTQRRYAIQFLISAHISTFNNSINRSAFLKVICEDSQQTPVEIDLKCAEKVTDSDSESQHSESINVNSHNIEAPTSEHNSITQNNDKDKFNNSLPNYGSAQIDHTRRPKPIKAR